MPEAYIRRTLQFLAAGRNGRDRLGKIFSSYHNPSAKLMHRMRYYPFHKAIDYFVGKTGISPAVISDNLSLRPWAVQALVNGARSIAEYGLMEPQDFIGPLAVVWDTTNRCNLACRHCFLNSGSPALDELSRREKISVVDQLADNDVPIVVIAGGEPLMDPDLWSVLERTRQRGIYSMLATNGTLLDPESCKRLLASGVKYVQVSLDSADSDIHDNFRGVKGSWERSVQGIRNAVKSGLECGVAACFVKETIGQARDVVNLAITLGATTFVHFKFLPLGRGAAIAEQNLDPPEERELLVILEEMVNMGKIEIWSTAPDFGSIFLKKAIIKQRPAAGGDGRGKGAWVDIFSKYMGGCGAGRYLCAIQPNGHVTSCASRSHDIVGYLREENFAQIWGRCQIAAGHCKSDLSCGGCRHEADSPKGDSPLPDLGCLYKMLLFSRLEKLFVQSRQAMQVDSAG